MAMRRPVRRDDRPTHAPDYLLLTVVLLLSVIGIIAVYSASYALGEREFHDPNYFVKRQAIFMAAGLVIMLVTMRLPYHALARLSPLIMFASLAGLALVLMPGIGFEQNGARSWIRVGGLPPLQPSEFAKFGVIVYLAAWLNAKGEQLKDFSLGVLPFVTMVGLVAALIMLEGDLGTTIVIGAITGTLFFVAGARVIHTLTLAGAASLAFALLLLTGDQYRMDRLTSFLHAENDPLGAGFHTLQLLVAFGSGGIDGLGLGVSRQKFFYVPGSHTDGILAIIGEELGFIGTCMVLGLFMLLLARGWMIVKRADGQFGSLLAAGILAWIAFQALINIGGVTRLMPLTGIPLPFVSYGGTALLAIFAATGVLLSISRYTNEEVEARAPSTAARRTSPTLGGAR
ncbi:MAG: putative lipid II flippase FtsW [Dehalococcoidia bacterium]|nr:MAG: putative lipid II flippase FtsW [Dehalococcoidia bacterium]